jgi:hypothetical protein
MTLHSQTADKYAPGGINEGEWSPLDTLPGVPILIQDQGLRAMVEERKVLPLLKIQHYVIGQAVFH